MSHLDFAARLPWLSMLTLLPSFRPEIDKIVVLASQRLLAHCIKLYAMGGWHAARSWSHRGVRLGAEFPRRQRQRGRPFRQCSDPEQPECFARSDQRLQTTVNAIQNAAGTISAPDQSKFRITPGFFFNGTFSVENGNALLVNAINVSGVPHMIKAEVLDPSGEAILTINPGSVVQPFDAISGTLLVPNAGPWFVRFTVSDGSRANIRGSGQQINYLRGTTGVALAAE